MSDNIANDVFKFNNKATRSTLLESILINLLAAELR